MKITAHNRTKLALKRALFSAVGAVFVLAGMLGCSGGSGGDPGEEGGLIGTGIIHGTVSETKQLASESVEIKASTGQRTVATLNRNRRFAAGNVEGDAPFLVRSDLGNGAFRYAIVYERGDTSNVHSYSDLILREWYAANNGDIDSDFNSGQPLTSLPTEQQFDQISQKIFSIVSLVLESYNVTGEQLLSATFDADDRGVDEYLDKNPVVINGRDINLLLTDPETEIQSSTLAGLTLGSSLTAAQTSTSAPTRVARVRALGSTLDEIVVFWDPAIDDIGVIGYRVLRDGVQVMTTPFPVFVDTNLQSGGLYEYVIVAIDADGNQSIPSESAFASTLGSIDTEAPPTPTNVTEVEASASLVVLRWDVANIPDVVAFNVLRGQPGQALERLIRSTSNTVSDRSVSGGTTFCYAVEALDAAGNTSPPSEQLCVNTDGNAVSGSVGTGDNNTVTGNTQSVAGLNIPDVGSVSCTATLPSSITEDMTLDQPCYMVNDDVEILGFADVVIPAGTILKFTLGVGLDVTTNASLAVNGTQNSPVVFTGQEESVGYWRGITFDQADKAANQIVNAVIEYAGSSSNIAALTVRSFTASPARLRVQGSLIRRNERFGVSISGASALIDSFANNTVTENGTPADFGPRTLPLIGTSNIFTGNTNDRINVPRLPILSDLAIPDLGVPLLTNGLTVSQRTTLTIDAGVEMLFGPNTGLFIEQSDLIVNGTADNPVTFTGRQSMPGNWGGVQLTDSTGSSLQGLIIEYGGDPVGRFSANLGLVNSTAALNNVTLRDSSGYGIFLDDSSQFSSFTDVQQINNTLQQ